MGAAAEKRYILESVSVADSVRSIATVVLLTRAISAFVMVTFDGVTFPASRPMMLKLVAGTLAVFGVHPYGTGTLTIR